MVFKAVELIQIAQFLKVHFANPVYESMYAGSSEPALPSNNSSNCSAPEEKKGLLQHTQDESNAQDLL